MRPPRVITNELGKGAPLIREPVTEVQRQKIVPSVQTQIGSGEHPKHHLVSAVDYGRKKSRSEDVQNEMDDVLARMKLSKEIGIRETGETVEEYLFRIEFDKDHSEVHEGKIDLGSSEDVSFDLDKYLFGDSSEIQNLSEDLSVTDCIMNTDSPDDALEDHDNSSSDIQ